MASADPSVRAIHLEMAERYAALAKASGVRGASAPIERQQAR